MMNYNLPLELQSIANKYDQIPGGGAVTETLDHFLDIKGRSKKPVESLK